MDIELEELVEVCEDEKFGGFFFIKLWFFGWLFRNLFCVDKYVEDNREYLWSDLGVKME